MAATTLAWRLDREIHGAPWDNGEGAYGAGGRRNSKGAPAVYCSIDPAAAILEVAVHTGFKALDMVPHVLTSVIITEPSSVQFVDPASVPNPIWLRPRIPGAGQQAFGDTLLGRHKIIVIPSAVSAHSWNLFFAGAAAAGAYAVRSQEPFALDTRLPPPPRRINVAKSAVDIKAGNCRGRNRSGRGS